MPNRKLMIQIHLVIASFFLPLMLMMPMTGTLYLWNFKGEVKQTEVFRMTGPVPDEQKEQESFFRKQFQERGIDYDFEYVRVGTDEFTLRPVTRDHFVIKKAGDELVFFKVEPSLLKRMIELHKGHGPVAMRWFEAAFGISLILITLSGLWLAFTVPAYRKQTLISFALGVAVIAFCLV